MIFTYCKQFVKMPCYQPNNGAITNLLIVSKNSTIDSIVPIALSLQVKHL